MIAKPLRLVTVSALLMLSACAAGNSSADLAPAAPAAQQTAAAPAPPPPPRGPRTPEQVKAECWMKYEGDKKIKNIDQRLSLVEKCVDETQRDQLVQRPQR